MTFAPYPGWVLITREETNHETGEKAGKWYLAWHELFSTKKSALAFAHENGWRSPFKAVRASISHMRKP